jgi:molecular chaperone DnaJ
MHGKDYYKILGIDKNASEDDIKKAFRKLAHQHHPDKNGGDDKKFKEISEAYAVLSDSKKRQQYDTFGSADNMGGGNPFGGQGFEGFDFSQFNRNGQGFEFDMGDIFGDIFGGGGRRERVKRGRDVSVDLEITFSEAVFGVEKKIKLTKNNTCKVCQGSGAKAGSATTTCSTCNGHGIVREAKRSIFGAIQTEKMCPECNGAGKVAKEKCSECRGAGITKSEAEYSVKIPAGINEGESMRLSGAGEAIAGGQPGDLYIRIHVKDHPIFEKVGNDLTMVLEVKLTEALLGSERSIETLDGQVTVKIPEGVNNGEILRLKGKGVPHGRGRGDILIEIRIKMPNRLSRDAKKLIENLKNEGL